MEHFSYFDLFFALILYFFFVARANKKKDKYINQLPYYQFYVKGLSYKLIGSLVFCTIYLFYYKGGDTINYYQAVKCMNKLFWTNPSGYFDVMSNGPEEFGYTYTYFNMETDWPSEKFIFKDSRTLLIVKFCSVLSFFGFGGFYSTTIILANLAYKWIWNGFQLVAEKYQNIQKQMAISFLFIPSVIFWGSGIMKDTFTYSATCFALYGVYQIFILKKNLLYNSIQLLIAIYLIISIKAYILFALLPGILVYTNFERIAKIKSWLIKIILIPGSIVVIIVIAQTFFINFGDEFGKYSADRILEEAAIQQQDLKRVEAYGGNSFDIGEFDPSLGGIVSKIPLAINAALFRPYLWEVGSPTMLFSAIENTIIQFVIIYFLLKIGPFQFFRYIFKDPYLIFCLLFTLVLAFGIGLSTANFGALVRYKIPFTPFFISLFYVLNWYVKGQKTKLKS